MNKDNILQQVILYKQALAIATVPQWIRSGILLLLCIFFGIALGVSVFVYGALYFPHYFSTLTAVPFLQEFFIVAKNNSMLTVYGVFCFATLYILFAGLEAMFHFYYLKGVKRVFQKEIDSCTYEVSEIFLSNSSFFEAIVLHRESAFLWRRLMITPQDVVPLFSHIDIPYDISQYMDTDRVTLGVLFRALYSSNEAFSKHLFTLGVQKDSFIRATFWMDRMIENRKIHSAWWWRENLSKTRGFAKTLSYGMTQYLSHFAEEMVYDPKIRELGDTILHQKEKDTLEEILAKNHGANAVIVGNHGSGRYSIALALARSISEGGVYSEIEFKRMFLLKAGSFELINSKEELEYTIISIFNEAVTARNIIFVIDDIVKLVELCKSLGCDFLSIINPYISHSSVSVVIITDESTRSKDEYRHVFDERFETIILRDLSENLFLPYLEDKAIAFEQFSSRIFSYQALESIARILPTFFVEEAPLVKGEEILRALVDVRSDHVYITSDDVDVYLKSITGVPLGKVTDEEKQSLLNLESILSEQVKGQKEALRAIARTMRRIRSGIISGDKPMGTFLFLGSTGSGKTETAKTLARVFFGTEDHMSRIDMGEYALLGSVDRLLGTSQEEGELSRLVHTRPYGVLLLDEFEKSSKDVKDLFLRILDEGVFTNGMGKIVSLRTQIIIATSNAGTQYIIDSHLSASDDEEKVEQVKRNVIDAILEQGIFKPELVNRFDGTVMYLPLSEEASEGVTRKMLQELHERLLVKGYNVEWSDDLVEFLSHKDTVSEFGGRAIQRTIQDTVEDALSKKIIDGTLSSSEVITITKADIDTK
jgi:ATP-dependent Clp protease ATP-binding subunit ClpA